MIKGTVSTIIEHGTLPTPQNPYPSNEELRHTGEETIIVTPVATAGVLEEYKQATAIYPADINIRLQYARALRVAGYLTAGKDEALMATRIDPNSADAHFELASILHDQGDYDQAIAEFVESGNLAAAGGGSEHDESRVIVMGALADTLSKAARPQEALTAMTKAVKTQKAAVRRGQGNEYLLERLTYQLKTIKEQVKRAP